MKTSINVPTIIVGKCTSFQDFANFMHRNCGLNCDLIESRANILACDFAMMKNISFSLSDSGKIIFHPKNINLSSEILRQ